MKLEMRSAVIAAKDITCLNGKVSQLDLYHNFQISGYNFSPLFLEYGTFIDKPFKVSQFESERNGVAKVGVY